MRGVLKTFPAAVTCLHATTVHANWCPCARGEWGRLSAALTHAKHPRKVLTLTLTNRSCWPGKNVLELLSANLRANY